MTTLRVTTADVGIRIGQAGVLSSIRFLVAGRAYSGNFCLVDDSLVATWNGVSKALYCSDLLGMPTNSNGQLQPPYGSLLENGNISFGNLVVQAVPTDAVLEIDATGILPLAQLEQARQLRDERNKLPPAPPYIPPVVVEVAPPPPPPPPHPELITASRTAREQVAAERARRAAAQGPQICGRSQMEIETELFLVAQWKLAASAAADADAYYARVEAALKAQAEAQAQLKEQGS
jgi:hypothetical protein